MAQYKLYLLSESGMIASAVWLECADDEDALRQAEARAAGAPSELWLGGRMIQAFGATVSADPKA